MLSKLFRPRQPTTSPSSPFKPSPTTPQPGDSKTPSRFIRKIKELKTALSPKLFSKKVIETSIDADAIDPPPQDGARESDESPQNNKTSSLNRRADNREPVHFTAQDDQFQRPHPASTHQFTTLDGLSSTGPQFSTRSAAPRLHLPVNSSAPFVATPEDLANGSLHLPVHTSPVKSEAPAVGEHITAIRARKEGTWRDETHGIEAIRYGSERVQVYTPRITHITERYTPQVAVIYDAGKHFVQEVKAPAKAKKRGIEGQEKWSEMEGNLRTTEGRFRRGWVDQGSRIELKGSQVTRCTQRTKSRHSPTNSYGSNVAVENEPIIWKQKAEYTRLSTTTNPPECHCPIQRDQNLSGAAQAPNWPAEWQNDDRTMARPPFALLDLDLGPPLDPSLWLGQSFFDTQH